MAVVVHTAHHLVTMLKGRRTRRAASRAAEAEYRGGGAAVGTESRGEARSPTTAGRGTRSTKDSHESNRRCHGYASGALKVHVAFDMPTKADKPMASGILGSCRDQMTALKEAQQLAVRQSSKLRAVEWSADTTYTFDDVQKAAYGVSHTFTGFSRHSSGADIFLALLGEPVLIAAICRALILILYRVQRSQSDIMTNLDDIQGVIASNVRTTSYRQQTTDAYLEEEITRLRQSSESTMQTIQEPS